MSILSDNDIIDRCLNVDKPMIDPFISVAVSEIHSIVTGQKHKVVSFGLSSYGYDARVGYEFQVFSNLRSRVVDPKNFDPGVMERVETNQTRAIGETLIIPPNSFALGTTLERFWIPRDILVICLGKSTYARCGIIVNVTPFEPEWEGHVTVEISNTAPVPAVIYPGEGIFQAIFLKADRVCYTSYADKKGKYQGQGPEITNAKV